MQRLEQSTRCVRNVLDHGTREHDVELAETRDLIQLVFAPRRDDLDSVLLHERDVAGERAAVALVAVARDDLVAETARD